MRQYYISVPPLAADKTQLRADQAWRIRALGPAFHALAEINVTGWTSWVAATGNTWYAAGVEARRRMAAAGYDVAAGDTWALNELSSAVRQGTGNARANMRAFLHGLTTATACCPRPAASSSSPGSRRRTGDLSVYQARLQDWYEDAAFWTDLSRYVERLVAGALRRRPHLRRRRRATGRPPRLAERVPAAPAALAGCRPGSRRRRRARFSPAPTARSRTPPGSTTPPSAGRTCPSS